MYVIILEIIISLSSLAFFNVFISIVLISRYLIVMY